MLFFLFVPRANKKPHWKTKTSCSAFLSSFFHEQTHNLIQIFLLFPLANSLNYRRRPQASIIHDIVSASPFVSWFLLVVLLIQLLQVSLYFFFYNFIFNFFLSVLTFSVFYFLLIILYCILYNKLEFGISMREQLYFLSGLICDLISL